MGGIDKGDLIIVTNVLTSFEAKATRLIGTVQKVIIVDTIGFNYLYLIKVNDVSYWVDGIPYSSLVMELF
jgi:hypothetical protein